MLLELLPKQIAVLLPELSLIAIGYAIEKHYISRVTCFTNVLALNVHLLTIGKRGPLIGLYADFGLILGVWGFIAYLKEQSLNEWYYNVSHVAYSSLLVGAIILSPQVNWLIAQFLPESPFSALWLIAAVFITNLPLLGEADDLHYRLSRRASVNQFIGRYRVRFLDKHGRPATPYRSLEYWFGKK